MFEIIEDPVFEINVSPSANADNYSSGLTIFEKIMSNSALMADNSLAINMNIETLEPFDCRVHTF